MHAGLVAVALLVAGTAMAQYKIVAPDGRVTYTDRPDPQTSGKVSSISRSGLVRPAEAASSPQPLPYELRQVATRFPVTLYTTPDCPPCDRGRRLLQQRGVPYAERQVQSNEDLDALERLAATRTVPVLSVGAQLSRGWLETEWIAVLDGAGYPPQSRLPRDWQAPPVTPLVARPEAPARTAAEPAAPATPAAAAPKPPDEGPQLPSLRF